MKIKIIVEKKNCLKKLKKNNVKYLKYILEKNITSIYNFSTNVKCSLALQELMKIFF